jgi:hypothetical protein
MIFGSIMYTYGILGKVCCVAAQVTKIVESVYCEKTNEADIQ